MTDEEAINTINSLKQYYNDKNEDSYVGFDDEDNEALDMAIKALETTEQVNTSHNGVLMFPKGAFKAIYEDNDDCISRQAVKDMLTEEWAKYMPMELDMNLSFVLDKISALPSVTPQPKNHRGGR